MRVPHTVVPNTYQVYRPSASTLRLGAEKERTLRSEDVEWDQSLPPSLVAICVEALVEDFANKQVLDELPNEDRDLLYETLPTDLELPLTVPILVDDIYWQRSAKARWTSGNYVKDYGNSWKRLYLERHIEEYLETMMVEDYKLDDVTALVNLCAFYVRRLKLRQLQLAKPPPVTEEEGDECTIEPEPTEHINLDPVLQGLPFLHEIDLTFGVRECGMNFEWRLFKFSLKDCDQLGSGLNRCKHLKILRIHRSMLDDVRLITLLQHLVKNHTLTELDLTHCQIGDTGALAIGKLLTLHPALTIVNLCNNKIGARGAQGLAYALTQGGCPLDRLSLRLNVIGEDGTIYLCSALAKSARPRELILAGCGITEAAIIKIGQMLQQNKTLQYLDLTNNHLGETGGEALELGLKDNSTLLRLDLRMTGVGQEQEFAINAALATNTAKWKRKHRRMLALEGADRTEGGEDYDLLDGDSEGEEVKLTQLEGGSHQEVVKVEAPKVEGPKVEALKIDAPKVEAPKVDASKIDVIVEEEEKVEEGKVEEGKLEEENAEGKVEEEKVEEGKVEEGNAEGKVEEEKVEEGKVEEGTVEEGNAEGKVEGAEVEGTQGEEVQEEGKEENQPEA